MRTYESGYRYNPRTVKSIWADGSRKTKLDYCERQIKLLYKWFDETENVFFVHSMNIWRERIEHIKQKRL